MAVVEKSALVQHSAGEMYRLVNDVEQYQNFLPWCKSSRLVSLEGDTMIGELVVAKSGVTQSFSTRNTLTENRRVELQLDKGPFKRLTGQWEFTPLREDACKVSLRLEFEFSGRLMNAAFGAVFSQIANTMVDSFCKRADEIYAN
ncbi:type II toxin-antitoxin system RatA family toxin [Solemya velum gill symbiont]|uniref:Oligoketide cyclase/lipid transport protein n=1 Tax=Solemya velum gill symbiont TaxID=2340 RepID=A0A0B0H925_SOVGS|nr:type II toxin-antitoxin system RatA family toxin [Solemya velum gill symbiont]KHF25167.1 oligoketide cyclase/lipid transport protein [Solemya velum gill symbiont]OOY34887.1 ubiquinone-binding protein [Solemya velum gill symbiont]OOY37602.1 ubiquinone-binding protein [Solemya velum gill symbiont]OOY40645.1 ubiquinone-binding protein [Solemya velum gill symbiont]OOY41897.1 ubiquinone-binding protein [Solemya velum gill symbiont]